MLLVDVNTSIFAIPSKGVCSCWALHKKARIGIDLNLLFSHIRTPFLPFLPFACHIQDIPASIQDDRISTVSDRLSEDGMFKIYKLQVKTEFVPHFTTDLQTNLEAIPDPVERTRPKAMILSNGQE